MAFSIVNIGYFTVAVLAITLFMFFSGSEGLTSQEFLNNISYMEEDLFNMTTGENATLAYNSLYTGEITVEKVIYNIAHSILYSYTVMINTMFPIGLQVMDGTYAVFIVTILVLYFLVCLIVYIPRLIYLSIMLYFFISEKRKAKKEHGERWYQ